MADVTFLTADEIALNDRYMRDGFVSQPAEDAQALERIRDAAAALAAEHLGVPLPADRSAFLDGIGAHVTPERLNPLRLAVFDGLNREPWFRPAYFALGRRLIATLVGNELAMQRRVNLSIQLPHDDSSLLAVHADVWSGDSPFEAVMWLPLVDCYGTKTMYLMPPAPDAEIQAHLKGFDGRDSDELYAAIEPHVRYLDVKFGHVIVFNQNLMHGNRVNTEAETRWSMNCRFKSVFAPYGDKKLGEFFDPITLRAATRVGMSHVLPGGFEE